MMSVVRAGSLKLVMLPTYQSWMMFLATCANSMPWRMRVRIWFSKSGSRSPYTSKMAFASKRSRSTVSLYTSVMAR